MTEGQIIALMAVITLTHRDDMTEGEAIQHAERILATATNRACDRFQAVDAEIAKSRSRT